MPFTIREHYWDKLERSMRKAWELQDAAGIRRPQPGQDIAFEREMAIGAARREFMEHWDTLQARQASYPTYWAHLELES